MSTLPPFSPLAPFGTLFNLRSGGGGGPTGVKLVMLLKKKRGDGHLILIHSHSGK